MIDNENELNIIDTSAVSAAFGWDFQSSLALAEVMKEIKNLKYFKVEGKTEDIELYYYNKPPKFIQSKSKMKPHEDLNVNTHLKNGLKTLINLSQTEDYSKLVYGTNIENPFLYKQYSSWFSGGVTEYSYDELPNKIQLKIQKYIAESANENNFSLENFDFNRLFFLRFPFFGEDDETRYRFVKNRFEKIMDGINLKPIQVSRIFDKLLLDFKNNSSKEIVLEKTEIAWIIVFSAIEGEDERFFEEFDVHYADEEILLNSFGTFVEGKTHDYNLFNEITEHFLKLSKERYFSNTRNSTKEFVEDFSPNYESKIFFTETSEQTLLLTKYILWKILTDFRKIQRINKEVGLL
jgi:hypothetical protein